MSSYSFKKIEDFTAQELDEAIDKAVEKHGTSFWVLLTGIDAYFERRERKLKREHCEAYLRGDNAQLFKQLRDSLSQAEMLE